jgi:putative acetyltransferase
VDPETLVCIQQEASVAALGHIFPPGRHPFPRADVLDHWRTFAGSFLVAERDGGAIGFAAVAGCWLVALYVLPGEWGSGVAARLHDDALAAIRRDGCREAHLWVLEQNDRARRFYERRGWRRDGTERVVPYAPKPIEVGYSRRL